MSKKIGIISGAGAMAGCLFYKKIITNLQVQGCWRDADFPEIVLINVPFPEMLSESTLFYKVRKALLNALEYVSPKVDAVYIACQTLHIFLLEKDYEKYKVEHLLKSVKPYVESLKTINVVSSLTSRLWNLHPMVLGAECQYIKSEESKETIELILRGIKPNLTWLKDFALSSPVLLGCTEFSVAVDNDPIDNVIDPLDITAKIIANNFLNSV